jgi:hypothetical protein
VVSDEWNMRRRWGKTAFAYPRSNLAFENKKCLQIIASVFLLSLVSSLGSKYTIVFDALL